MLVSHEEEMMERMRDGAEKSLAGAGELAAEAVREKMRTGYGAPIRRSGRLMESIGYRVENGQMIVGTDVPYAANVHATRPFVTDGMKAAMESMAHRCETEMAAAMR